MGYILNWMGISEEIFTKSNEFFGRNNSLYIALSFSHPHFQNYIIQATPKLYYVVNPSRGVLWCPILLINKANINYGKLSY